MFNLPDLIASLLDDLREIAPSTDRLGKENWLKFGSPGHCWRCGGRFGAELEPGSQVLHHILPQSEGGPNTPDNKALLCSNCHSVVHRYYLPTGKIGKKRTRDGATRLVGNFKGGIRLAKVLPSADHNLGDCHDCGTTGTVTGVTEGYWHGEGLLVFMDCPACGLKFAEPFIGTSEPPAIDQISAICRLLESNLGTSPQALPPELRARLENLNTEMVKLLRKLRSKTNSTIRNTQRVGLSDSETKLKVDEVRKEYVSRMKLLLPEAERLTEECKPYRQPLRFDPRPPPIR